MHRGSALPGSCALASRAPRAGDRSDHPPQMRLAPRLGQRLAGLLHRPAVLASVRNAGWLFAERLLRMALGVLVGAWVARHLGPAQFGELTYVLSFVAIFSAVAQLGMDSVAVRDIARQVEDAPEILGTALRLRLIAGAAAWAAATLFVVVGRPSDHMAFVLTAIAATTLVLQAADCVDLWFQACLQNRRSSLCRSAAFLAAAAFKLALIALAAPLLAFAAAIVLEAALAAALLAWSYRGLRTPGRWRWNRTRARLLLRESAPLLLAGVAVIYMRVDQVVLREIAGERELGWYSAALAISSALIVVPMAICASVAPSLARLREADPARYRHRLGTLFALMWWLMIPACAAVAWLARPLVLWLYGEAYAPAAAMLAIHAVSAVPAALGVAQSLWIVNERRNQLSLYRTLLGACTSLGLNLALVPVYGGQGAAWAAIGAQLVAAVLSNLVLAPTVLALQIRTLLFPWRWAAA
jgi:O-antigen/teichoic acid export membrane protein